MPSTPEPEPGEPAAAEAVTSELVVPEREVPAPASTELVLPELVVPEPVGTDLAVPDSAMPEGTPAEPAAAEPPAAEPSAAQPAGPLGNLVAAHLRRVEVAMLGRILTTTLAGALPAAMVRVERRRNLAEWLLRRPGHAIGISITSADKTLSFRAPDVGITEASVSHTVRGVVLSTTRVSVAEWLSQLADVLNATTDDDEATRAALERALLS